MGEPRTRPTSERTGTAATAPARCPRCEGPVDREREEWVACRGCLARLHASCWAAQAGCACGETRALEGAATSPLPSASADATPEEELSTLMLELAVRREHPQGIDARLPLLLEPGQGARLRLRLRNASPTAQSVQLRQLPTWLVARGKERLELAPGEEGALLLELVGAAFPTELARPRRIDERGRDPFSGPPAGSFLVSTEDEAVCVGLWVWSPPGVRHSLGWGVLGGLWLWPFGLLVVILCLAVLLARPRAGAPPELEAFLERARRVDRRAAWRTLALTLGLGVVSLGLLLALFHAGVD